MIEFKHSNPDIIKKTFDDIGNKATLKIAMKITAQAKMHAPVAKEHGGRLRNSIMWKVGKTQGGLNDSPDDSPGRQLDFNPENDMSGAVGLNLDYGVYQEFGTRYMPPQPYLRPAIALVTTEQTAAEIRKMIDDEHLLGKLQENQVRENFY